MASTLRERVHLALEVRIGAQGHVVASDMAEAMLHRMRENARAAGPHKGVQATAYSVHDAPVSRRA